MFLPPTAAPAASVSRPAEKIVIAATPQSRVYTDDQLAAEQARADRLRAIQRDRLLNADPLWADPFTPLDYPVGDVAPIRDATASVRRLINRIRNWITGDRQ